MPKGKRKGKFEHKRTEQAYSSDEDAGIDMTIDNCSETSAQSDLKSLHDEPDPSEPDMRRRARVRRELKETVPQQVIEVENANEDYYRNYYFDKHGKWTKRPPPPPPPNPSEPDTRRRTRVQRDPRPKHTELTTVDEESDPQPHKFGTVFNHKQFNNLFYDIYYTKRYYCGYGPQEAPLPQNPSEPDTRRRTRVQRNPRPKNTELKTVDEESDPQPHKFGTVFNHKQFNSLFYDVYYTKRYWGECAPQEAPPPQNPSEPGTRRRTRVQRDPRPKDTRKRYPLQQKFGTVFNDKKVNNLFYDIYWKFTELWYGYGPKEAPAPQKTEIEKFEDKVLELIDNLEARAATARATAFVNLRTALQRRPLFHVIAPRRVTLAGHVSKALRRGRDGEKKAAAALAPVLALQIGEEGTEEFLNELRPALVAAATDKTASVDTRAECCSSLAVICLLLEEDLSEIIEIMRMYETIFSGSYLKGDGSLKVSGSVIEEGSLHGAALDGWALLLSLLSDDHAAEVLRNHPPSVARLGDLLEACSLDVRVAAGGALALAHEHTRACDGSLDALVERLQLVPRLQQLARDSHKYRAKRDRKLQRATFRDILKYFEEDEVPSFTVRVGNESVECSSWALCAGYTQLASALGGGLQTLATGSPALRAALRLPDAPPAPPAPKRAQDKLQRHLQNTAACKARTVARGKNRDKRSAALAI